MSGGMEPMLPFGEEPKEEPPKEKPLNAYEQKQADKKERLLEAADKARLKADDAFDRSSKLGSAIPFGQPILVGHHSEGRHRRDIKRIDDSMRKGVEQSNKAAELERRAAKVGTGGVSADDPDAVQKLQEKLQGLEKVRGMMKLANKQFRQGGWDAVDAVTEKVKGSLMELSEAQRMDKPFESYQLSNIGANIRRIKQRIEALAKEASKEVAAPVDCDGFQIIEDKQTNRVKLLFDGKPSAETRKVLKQNGFRWAPSVEAWQRQLNAEGRFAAKRVQVLLEGTE